MLDMVMKMLVSCLGNLANNWVMYNLSAYYVAVDGERQEWKRRLAIGDFFGA
jgi:hypothetical protein